MLEALYRRMLQNCPEPPLRDVNGQPNDDWRHYQEVVTCRPVPREALLAAIAEEDRVIDEMIGLRSPPQYPHPEDAERVFPPADTGQYYRDGKTVEWHARVLPECYNLWG